MTDNHDDERDKRFGYVNGAGVSNEDLMQGIYEIRNQLAEVHREIQDLEKPMHRTADNTERIAESLEGLIEKATDKWRVPLPAFLVVVGTLCGAFLLLFIAITHTEFTAAFDKLSAGSNRAEKRAGPESPG